MIFPVLCVTIVFWSVRTARMLIVQMPEARAILDELKQRSWLYVMPSGSHRVPGRPRPMGDWNG